MIEVDILAFISTSLDSIDARDRSSDSYEKGTAHGVYDCEELEVIDLVMRWILASACLAQLKVSCWNHFLHTVEMRLIACNMACGHSRNL